MYRIVLAAAVCVTLPLWGGAVAPGVRADARAEAQQLPPQPVQPLPPLPATQIDPRQVTLDSARRLTLTFAEPRPIDEVLGLLTAGTPFSIAIDADASGVFRGELKQLTLREALTAVLAPIGLDFQVQGTVIRVRRRQMETRVFDMDLLNVQRGLVRAGGNPAVALTTSVPAEDVMGSIADGVKALLSERGAIHVDRRAGLVQVTDFSDRLDRVALYVETLHQRGARQVRLQAQAFEVTLRQAPSIDWRLVRERLGLPGDGPDGGLAVDPAALRAALAGQGDVRVLWAPDVTTINNEAALMRMVAPGGTSLTMTVVPQISADGIVQMSVSHAWEEQGGDRKDARGAKPAPATQLAESDTVMRVMDGHTAIITGLMRPHEIAVPTTGRMASIFGSSSSRQRVQAELVVLLRPSVVRQP